MAHISELLGPAIIGYITNFEVNMSTKDIVQEKIQASISVKEIDITDDSEAHRGHAGYREGGETHFTVRVVSPDFEGLGAVKRHKMIYSILKEELEGQIHALAIKAIAPSEQ